MLNVVYRGLYPYTTVTMYSHLESVKLHNAVTFQMLHCGITFDEKMTKFNNFSHLLSPTTVTRGTQNFLTGYYENVDLKTPTFLYLFSNLVLCQNLAKKYFFSIFVFLGQFSFSNCYTRPCATI